MPEKVRTVRSIDQFRHEAQGAKEPIADARVRASFEDAEMKVSPDNPRKLTFTISNESVDRMGDTIALDGWQLDAYKKNPVVLWAHDSGAPPVAKSPRVWKDAPRLRADVEFTPHGLMPFNDAVLEMYKGGFLSATSVGFVPLKYAFTEDPKRRFGIDFIEQELLEFSLVPVPANAEALIEGKASGIDLGPMLEWAERLVQRAVRDAGSEAVERANASDWRCGAARNLPIDESDAWDGAAAAKRMLDAAGFGGEKPDSNKARKGFLAWDSANPGLRGSYKLPFADIVGGKLEAVAGGLRNAAARLPQTDIPDNIRNEARSVLDGYFARINPQDGKSIEQRAEDTLRAAGDAERIIRLAGDVLGKSGDIVAIAWAEKIMAAQGRVIVTPERVSKISNAEFASARVRRRQQRLAALRVKSNHFASDRAAPDR